MIISVSLDAMGDCDILCAFTFPAWISSRISYDSFSLRSVLVPPLSPASSISLSLLIPSDFKCASFDSPPRILQGLVCILRAVWQAWIPFFSQYFLGLHSTPFHFVGKGFWETVKASKQLTPDLLDSGCRFLPPVHWLQLLCRYPRCCVLEWGLRDIST